MWLIDDIVNTQKRERERKDKHKKGVIRDSKSVGWIDGRRGAKGTEYEFW